MLYVVYVLCSDFKKHIRCKSTNISPVLSILHLRIKTFHCAGVARGIGSEAGRLHFSPSVSLEFQQEAEMREIWAMLLWE